MLGALDNHLFVLAKAYKEEAVIPHITTIKIIRLIRSAEAFREKAAINLAMP